MTDHTLGDGPIEEAYRRKMSTIASALDDLFNEGTRGAARETGFVLMVFPFGEHRQRPVQLHFERRGSQGYRDADERNDQTRRRPSRSEGARMTTSVEFQAAMDRLARDLSDKGMLIEAGWVGLRKVWLHPDTPSDQVTELRMAFFAGAAHLFASIAQIMEADAEPTVDDMQRLSLINGELSLFHNELVKHLTVRGQA